MSSSTGKIGKNFMDINNAETIKNRNEKTNQPQSGFRSKYCLLLK